MNIVPAGCARSGAQITTPSGLVDTVIKKPYPEGLSPEDTLHYDIELVGIELQT